MIRVYTIQTNYEKSRLVIWNENLISFLKGLFSFNERDPKVEK